MKNYRAVGSHVLLKAPPQPSEDEHQVGGIIVPDKIATALRAKASPVVELEILDAGPDCKVASKGDLAVVNINHVHGLPFEKDLDVAVVPEAQLLAVLKKEVKVKTPGPATKA